MPDTPLPDVVLADVAAIEADMPCARCGYNLRGLKPDGLCPECGTAIDWSLRGNFLKFADPRWLNKLRFGTTLMFWSFIIILAVLALMMFGPRSMRPLGGSMVIPLAHLIVSAIGTAAAMIVTSPEPVVLQAKDPSTVRKVVRVATALWLLGAALQWAGVHWAIEIVVGVSPLAGVVCQLGLLVCLRRLAIRVPDNRLANGTRALMMSAALCTVVSILLRMNSHRWGGVIVGLGFVCVVLVGMFVFSVWYIVLIVKYNSRFTEAAKFARAHKPDSPFPADVE